MLVMMIMLWTFDEHDNENDLLDQSLNVSIMLVNCFFYFFFVHYMFISIMWFM